MRQIEFFLWYSVLEGRFLIFLFCLFFIFFGPVYYAIRSYKRWCYKIKLFCRIYAIKFFCRLEFDKNRISSTSDAKFFINHLVYYPTPINFNYFYSFGSLAGVFLSIQIVTGIFLVRFYTPHIDLAFSSIEHIIRDVNHGWLFRYRHSNGASFFFLLVYLHILRGIIYKSFAEPRSAVWIVGVCIFFLIMATAFMGYVLPWGQMSFWGRTVITNLFSAIPFVGSEVSQWLWGGFSVSNATLNRFFSLHFVLPFRIRIFSVFHLLVLHRVGSSNPLGVDSNRLDRIRFYPYFYVKDLFSFFFVFFIFMYVVHYLPNFLGHSDNYISANPLVTPSHIVPEWYFLRYYRILRVVPQKLGGVVLRFGSILRLFHLSFLGNKIVSKQSLVIQSSNFQFIYQRSVWVFTVAVAGLIYIGSQPVEPILVVLGQVLSFFYFFILRFGFVGVWFLDIYFIKRMDLKK